MKTLILDELKKLGEKQLIPFHMPGHKRSYNDIFEEIGRYDITEITGYDNLHCPESIIRDSMNELTNLFHTKQSWYLVNGSTCGIQAAIASVCEPGDEIVIGRNCHKSVYYMIELLHLKAFYLMPQISTKYHLTLGMGGEAIEDLTYLIQNHDIKAVVITSPTYEGIVTDINCFKELLKKKNIPLIVDEAHGAHFIFHEYFPKSAVERGADLVIQSAHKTLPSLTQTAMLHLCSDKIKEKRIQSNLAVFETSSPSYLLLASAEYGVSYMDNYVDKVRQYVDNLDEFITKCGQLKYIMLLDKDKVNCYDYDRSKLVFLLRNRSMKGIDLFRRLYHQYHIELEMSNAAYCIAMTSVMDRKEQFDRLFEALEEIDKSLDQINETLLPPIICPVFEKTMEAWQCSQYDQEEISIEKSEGRICCSYITLYPPGIPLLVPGEKILKEIVENIKYYLYNGYNVTGLQNDKITVIK